MVTADVHSGQNSKSSETESLQQAIQYILDGIQDLVGLLSPDEKEASLREELMECGKFAACIMDWCGKMPAQRVKEALLSLIKKLNLEIKTAIQEKRFTPSQNDADASDYMLPHMREALHELGFGIQISNDRMAAFISIPSDFASIWSPEDIKQCLKQRGIVFGIDESVINSIFEDNKFDCSVRIVVGKDPVIGEDARLEDPLNLLKYSNHLFNNPNSKTNYKQSALFKKVSQGDLILKKIPARQGAVGSDVFGEKIECPAGLDIKMPIIDNCQRDESGLGLVSKVDGCAYADKDIIFVTKALHIKGNVDFETGNIDSNVSVTVSGDVLSDFSINSGQDIAVNGVIEGAEINAGNSVFCKRGVNGKDKAVINAGKNVECVHINSAEVYATNYVVSSGPIIKSKVAGMRVSAEGSNGQIMGGCINAWEDIYAQEIGSEMGVKTELVLGDELNNLQNRVYQLVDDLKSKKKKKKQTQRALNTLKTSGGDQEKIDYTSNALRRINQIVLKTQHKLDNAKRDLSYSETCVRMVRAEKCIYGGATIRIMGKKLVIKKPLGPTNVVYSDGKLLTLPYKERVFGEEEGEG